MVEVKKDSPETAAEVTESARAFIETMPRDYQRAEYLKRMAQLHESKGAQH